ncbi:hypothetical protein GCM10010988_25640 [Cnuibacter physcomitrellae]|uniref:Uncharacterized protein n=1 Tax=Cnuibacter physcomitrellae TaxID=1619308 RepID=A0A1X9LFA8_9MICO|nr:alpha/beta hydrolase [Cnuibacter physcomitrellae]ARJ03896.1 hypothetical protein B5808_00580 [Cnuibacter physcomitrellae]GGI39752.1 hypothetical protein GCM10010988_25640 [Cnuibacter physcomitrellae]
MADCLAATGGTLLPLVLALVLLALGAAAVLTMRRGGRLRRGAALGVVLALVLSASVAASTGLDAGPASAADAACTTPGADPTQTPAPATPVIGADQEVIFASGGVTFHGSYRGPVDTSAPVPGVAIVVGTGGVDRNGTAGDLQTDAYSWLADLLSAQGIASLRYDKLGTGATGLGPYTADPAEMLPLSYEQLRVQPARDALSFLAAQPGVDTGRLLLLGHSEGGAVALDIATHPGSAPPLAGLLLVEPAYTHILDIVSRQFTQEMDEVVAAGGMTADDEATLTTWMREGVDQIRSGTPPYPAPGPVPLPGATGFTQYVQGIIQSNVYGSDPAQMVITHAYRTAYGKDFDAIVADELASQVTIPTLITCGTSDFNTPCGDGSPGSGVLAVAAAFAPGVAQLEVIPDMVHILRDTGEDDVPAIADQLTYPFSQDFAARFSAYVARFSTEAAR